MKKKAFGNIFLTLILVVFMCGCRGAEGTLPTGSLKTMNTSSIFAMDTIMELQIYGDEALLTEAEARIRNLEKNLSITDENSEISHLNKEGSANLSAQTGGIMERALEMCKETEGALDISIYPVLKKWGFTTGTYQVPSESDINSLLKNVDYSKVKLEKAAGGSTEYRAEIQPGMQIDLGSVAKGFTSTMLDDFFKENNVESGLINLGGNVQCIGTKPNGEKWKIAIKSPFPDSKSGIFGVLNASDTAVITSGGYERYFEENGEIYWHILDPSTGRPAKNGLISVTIVGKDGLKCDALSTALFVKGLEGAIEYYKAHDDFEGIFIAEDGTCYVTQGIADDFSLASEYYNSEIKVVSR